MREIGETGEKVHRDGALIWPNVLMKLQQVKLAAHFVNVMAGDDGYF